MRIKFNQKENELDKKFIKSYHKILDKYPIKKCKTIEEYTEETLKENSNPIPVWELIGEEFKLVDYSKKEIQKWIDSDYKEYYVPILDW